MDIESARRRLRDEVRQLVEDRIAKGEPVRESWIVREVLAHHPAPQGADADWARRCAEEAVSLAVREVLSLGPAESDAEDPLTAAEHRAAADGHKLHARELEAFKKARQEGAACCDQTLHQDGKRCGPFCLLTTGQLAAG